MIPIRKTIKMSKRTSFVIPASWREEINLIPGNIVKIRIQNNYILINASNKYTTEITSTEGDGDQIYIPTEERKHVHLKEIEDFKELIDEVNKYIILKPLERNES